MSRRYPRNRRKFETEFLARCEGLTDGELIAEYLEARQQNWQQRTARLVQAAEKRDIMPAFNAAWELSKSFARTGEG